MLHRLCHYIHLEADPSARAVLDVDLWPLAYWDCGFESRREHGNLCLVGVSSCGAEVSMSG